ncbi:MAG: 30S ribosomal protein S27ae [Thermoprotei archaeon]|nr:MAG: 30S ribosomal protein S27ae [Thermoprotei archaeon]
MAHVHKLYEYDYEKGTIRLKNRICPRCRSIMAHHLKPVERWHCGKCGYTEFVTARRIRGKKT